MGEGCRYIRRNYCVGNVVIQKMDFESGEGSVFFYEKRDFFKDYREFQKDDI